MPNNKKLTIRTSAEPAISIMRNALHAEQLVYIAVVNKPLAYRDGQSCIAYIGTTKAGVKRIATSAAYRAPELLQLHGVHQLSFFVVTCVARKRVKTWQKLERALIITFKQRFGEPPKCNNKGTKQSWNDEHHYFTQTRLEGIIRQYSSPQK